MAGKAKYKEKNNRKLFLAKFLHLPREEMM